VTHDDEDLSFYLAALEGLSNPPTPVRAGISFASALRDLAAVAVTSDAAPDVLAAAERTIRDLIEQLGPAGDSGAQRSIERAGPAGRYMNHPFYGPANPVAVPMSIVRDGRGIAARVSYGVVSEGRVGQVHPGCLAAGVLSLVSLTAVSNGRRGRIQSVEIRYRSPAPLHTELRYRVLMTEREDGFTRLSATVQFEKQILVEASAVVAT
jgi:hypothetical protein